MTSQPPYQQPSARDQVTRNALIAAALIVAGGCGVYWLHSQGDIGQPLTCPEQYANWKSGAPAAAKAQSDARALTAAAGSEDIPGVASALEAIGGDAASLQADPMPACADPAGYWPRYLTEIKAAGDNAGTSSGLGALLLAAGPLKQVAGIQGKLSAELERTTGAAVPVAVPMNTATPSAAPVLPTMATVPAPSAVPLPTLATMAPMPTAAA